MKPTIPLCIALAITAIYATSCSKPRKPAAAPAPTAPQPATQTPANAEAANGVAAAGNAQPPEKPAPAPAAATPVVVEKPTVIPHFSVGKSAAFALPVVGKITHVRLTPTLGGGKALSAFGDVNGAQVIAAVVRADGGWAARQVTSSVKDGAALFEFRFPSAGSYVLWTLFRPPNQPVAAIPTFFSIPGKPPAPPEPAQATNLHRGKGGLEVALHFTGEANTCVPLAIATAWARKSASVSLTARGAATVDYIAVDTGGAALTVGTPQPDPEAASPSDKGSHAQLLLGKPGRWTIWAFGNAGKEALSARFDVLVKGDAPPQGCEP